MDIMWKTKVHLKSPTTESDVFSGDLRHCPVLAEDAMCPRCGYPLYGLKGNLCPECGRSVDLVLVPCGMLRRTWVNFLVLLYSWILVASFFPTLGQARLMFQWTESVQYYHGLNGILAWAEIPIVEYLRLAAWVVADLVAATVLLTMLILSARISRKWRRRFICIAWGLAVAFVMNTALMLWR